MNQFWTMPTELKIATIEGQSAEPIIIRNATKRLNPGNKAISAETLFKVSSSLYFGKHTLIFFCRISENNRRTRTTKAVSTNIIRNRLGKFGIIGSAYGKAKQKTNHANHISPNRIISSPDSIIHLIHKYSNFKTGATQC